jgi:hypothetical protein
VDVGHRANYVKILLSLLFYFAFILFYFRIMNFFREEEVKLLTRLCVKGGKTVCERKGREREGGGSQTSSDKEGKGREGGGEMLFCILSPISPPSPLSCGEMGPTWVSCWKQKSKRGDG